LADHVLLTDYTDIDMLAALVADFGRRFELVGVLSLTEKGLLPQAQLNARLGYRDNDVDAVRRVVDKGLMRARLAEDPSLAVAFRVAADAKALRDFAAREGFPVIVKPVDGAGSARVRLLESHADIDSGLAAIGFPVLVEKFYAGKEYSVESYSVDGRHHIVAVTQKTLFGKDAGRFVEAGHCVPADIPEAQHNQITQIVNACLGRLGVRWGLAHTEVIVADERAVIVETHTRNGGDHIVDLVRQACDVDLLDIAVTIRCGQEPSPCASGLVPHRAAAIRYFQAPPGKLLRVDGLATARTSPGVIDLQLSAHPGDTVEGVTSSDSRIGYVMTIGQTPHEAVSLATQAEASLTLDMVSPPPP
jgi:biotin carboxylase